MVKKSDTGTIKTSKEPVFIVKPAFRHYGLDYLHISLIALVIILVGLSFALATFKPGVLLQNCTYGSLNGTCNTPIHNSSTALAAAERALASYAYFNTSLSILPYFTLVNQSQVSYLPSSREWLVVMPFLNPAFNYTKFNVSMLLYDSNLTLALSSLQTLKPIYYPNNTVVALGTVSYYGKAPCSLSKPIPVWFVIDPYAPGAIPAMYTGINTSKKYGPAINLTYHVIFTGYASKFYSGYGTAYTQNLGRYITCASKQPRFTQFLSNLSIAYSGNPINNQTLYQIVLGSNLNITPFNTCMQNVTSYINNQALLAKLYNIVSTPQYIVNCRYGAIPQTLNYAINYTLKSLPNK